MWRAHTIPVGICRVEVTRYTDKSVWLYGHTERRYATGVAYFTTWEDAHKWLMLYAMRKAEAARMMLDQANTKLNGIKDMKPSTLDLQPND